MTIRAPRFDRKRSELNIPVVNNDGFSVEAEQCRCEFDEVPRVVLPVRHEDQVDAVERDVVVTLDKVIEARGWRSDRGRRNPRRGGRRGITHRLRCRHRLC